MNILDKTYPELSKDIEECFSAENVSYDNSKTQVDQNNIQDILDGLNYHGNAESPLDSLTFIDVNSDLVLPVENEAHTYYVLSFGATVHNVTFVKTDSSKGVIVYQNGEPNFKPNKTYELSFLYLNCLWGERS